VLDEMGLADGRFAVSSQDGASACVRTDEPADLTMDVATLATVFLGGHDLITLHAAGRVTVHRPAALTLADTMFRSTMSPWCSTRF
jgi:predicted acetyltransferase